MIKHNVDFISNTDDDLHCTQAAYLMIVKFFQPEFDMDWEGWSVLTGYEEGKGTWASATLLWLSDQGYSIKHISMFDYDTFAKDGGDYLIHEFGDEVGAWQVKHSNLPLEQERVKKLLTTHIIEHREPTQDNIKSYLNNGYLIRCLVNSQKLNGKSGYVGHSIVVSGYDDNGFIIQDPGLPPLRDRHVKFDDFEAAWADPNKEAKELDAIKL